MLTFAQHPVHRLIKAFGPPLLAGILLTIAVKSVCAEPLQAATDFPRIAQAMAQDNRPLLLLIEAEHCGYCQRLKAEHLQPMNNNATYRKRVVIRTLRMDGTDKIVDFDGNTHSQADFSQRYQAYLTPTVLFLDQHGQEIADRILGYNTPEYYGAYLDKAIELASAALVQAKENTSADESLAKD